jgi:hypothetical protein
MSNDNNSTAEPKKDDVSGGCPMKRSDGSYSFDWWKALSSPLSPHGTGGSKPLSENDVVDATSSNTCPVHTSTNKIDSCPVKNETRQQHQHQHQQRHPEYNVYSQPIDPTNQMPVNPNQFPAPGQTKPLSTTRVASSIPKV